MLHEIINKYGENISVGLEQEFKLNRYDYFNIVWNIPAKKIIKTDNKTRKILLKIAKKYKCVIISDAPRIWIDNVLKEIGIADMFKNKIFSGEGNQRKIFKNVFKRITNFYKLKPGNFIVIGDQESTDIIPARKLGMKTIFIHKNRISPYADYNIKHLSDIAKCIDDIK